MGASVGIGRADGGLNSSSTASINTNPYFSVPSSFLSARLTSFAACGTGDALRRLRAQAGRAWPTDAPHWLVDANVSLCEATALAATMSPAARAALSYALLTIAEEGHSSSAESAGASSDTPPRLTSELVAVTLRMLAGAALEAVARRCTDASNAAAWRQLWSDAAHVAVWTSAHAECVCAFERQGFCNAEPCVMHLPNFLSECDLSDLFARRMDARASSKDSAPLRQLLQRATSPGQRGWDTVMQQALKNDGVASVVRDSIAVCLLGLHPQLPPRARLGWRRRKEVMCVLQQTLYRSRGAHTLISCAVAVKEALRRRIAAIMHISPAEHAALSVLQHPVRHLLVPPCALPATGQLAAMEAFARAGRMLTNLSSVELGTTLSGVINTAFRRCVDGQDAPRFDTSWLGKGTISVAPRVQLVSMASSAWSLVFRANFLPFWTFCASHGVRASRLDAVQHEGVHSLNSATRLCALLEQRRALSAQRAALRTPSAALLTSKEAAALLGLRQGAQAASSRPKCVTDATELLRVDGGGTAEGAAMLLSFARVAAVTESLLTFELGDAVARLQARALLRRFLHPAAGTAADDDVVRLAEAELPKHAAHIHLCCECRRLATAHVGNETARTSAQAFNELGVAATMIYRQASDGCTELRCAKRSSAALRTALAFEADMQRRAPERLGYNSDAVMGVLTKRGASALIRRDAKSALEQTSVTVPCGTRPMLVLPLLGKAVRVFDNWMALCTLCGSAVIVRPHHRYGSEIVCMRCDPSMLYSEQEVATAAATVERRQSKVCRFCGK